MAKTVIFLHVPRTAGTSLGSILGRQYPKGSIYRGGLLKDEDLQLREMETTGLLHREVYHQVPPKVEYSLTKFGHTLNTAMAPLGEWGEENIERIEAISWDQVG